ncbi:MAG: hypothetical protein ACI4WW_02635 [Candidatus Coprovivens sp.]
MKKEEILEAGSIVNEQFLKNENYKVQIGCVREAQRAVDFYESRAFQNGAEIVNKQGKVQLEKPNMNMVKFHVDGKQANILAKSWKYNFIVNNEMLTTKKVSQFAEFQLKEMNFKEKTKTMVKDGLLKGTYCVYFYWDEDAIGELGTIKGALRCNVIDFNDVAVADPTIKDVQEQDWVIIRSRETVKNVRQNCTTLSEEDKEKFITPNSLTAIYKKTAEQNDDMITTYLKFFRQDGEVYFQSFTDTIALTEPTPLNPYVNIKEMRKKKDEVTDYPEVEIDFENHSFQEINKEKPIPNIKANLYPIEIGSFNEREKSIYGLSDVIDIIPNNRLVNKLISMNALHVMKTVINTIVAKQGALGNQVIDPTKIGQVLTDYTPYGTQGFYTLNQSTLPTTFYEMATSIFDFTTTLARTKDLVTEEAIQKDLSGVALQQVVSEQNKPVQQQQDSLWNSLAKIGKILEMFYKLFYRNARYTYFASDADRAKEIEEKVLKDYDDTSYLQEDVFNGEDYINTPFTIQVEVGEGSRYSEVMTQQILNDFYKSGTYSNLTIDQKLQYFMMIDKNMFSKKDEMIRLLEQEKNSQIEQLKAMNEQLTAQNQQQAINIKSMYDEFSQKIDIYNAELAKAQNEVKTLKSSMKNNQNV